jgi:hypothetical protein
MFRIQRAALTLAAVVALAGCSENPFEPDLAPEGEARFSYTGDMTGEFAAVGQLNRRNPNAGTWAIGDIQGPAESRVLGIFAQQRSATVINSLVVEWRGAQVGTVTCTATTVNCPFLVSVIIGLENRTGAAEGAYEGSVGTVTVTALTDDRAAGTFTVTLPDAESSAPEPPTIQVSGSFDVSLELDS